MNLWFQNNPNTSLTINPNPVRVCTVHVRRKQGFLEIYSLSEYILRRHEHFPGVSSHVLEILKTFLWILFALLCPYSIITFTNTHPFSTHLLLLLLLLAQVLVCLLESRMCKSCTRIETQILSQHQTSGSSSANWNFK